jgi:hypothetical protein
MEPLHINQFSKVQDSADSSGRLFPFMLDTQKVAAKLRELADEVEKVGGVKLVQEIKITQRAPLDDFTTTELIIVMHEAIRSTG